MIKYATAKDILAKYQGLAGTCPAGPNPRLDSFVLEVLQYLLLSGAYGNERKFSFHAVRGCFTLPKELEVPLKIKIDCAVGSVWSRWFEYQSGNRVDDPCLANNSVLEEPNRYPTAYDLPPCGGYPAVLARCEESEDAHVIVKGNDPTGRQIFTTHKGEPVTGVYLSLKKGTISRSNVLFGQITEVYKTETKGYVTLLSCDLEGHERQFLSDYDPYETLPSYRRIRILTPDCPHYARITVLGRICLKERYADEDLIPFDNRFLLDMAGQTINAMHNDDTQNAVAKDNYVKGLIETEGNYKKVNNGQPVEFLRITSGGAVVNATRAGRYLARRYTIPNRGISGCRR